MKHLFLSVFFVCLLSSFGVVAQQSATQVLSKQELAVKKAEDKIAKLERKMEIDDSLITEGNVVIADMKSEEQENNAKMKEIQANYSSESKRLDKQLKSKDREEVKQTMAEKKQLDAKNKAELKEQDVHMKGIIKRSDKASANIGKGKEMKKATEKELKVARKELAAAEKALNGPEKGKKKK